MISTTNRRAGYVGVLRRSMQVTCCSLLFWSCTFAQPEEDAEAVLRAEYPDFVIRPEVFEGSCADEDAETADSCVTKGDFNADGYKDFSAVLRRDISADELAEIDSRHRNKIQYVDLVVVCDGNADSVFTCKELTKPEIGGLPAVLELALWPDQLSDSDSASLTGECEALVDESPDMPILALTEPNGLCRSYFYAADGVRYERCTICGD